MKKIISVILAVTIIYSIGSVIAYAGPFDGDVFDFDEKIDYSELTSDDLINYEQKVISAPANPAKSDISIAEDENRKVLKWSTSEYTGRNQQVRLTIPLGGAFNAANGPFSLEFKAKLPKNDYRWIAEGFMNLETDKTKAANAPALRFGLGQYRGNTFVPVANNSVYFVRQDELKASDYFDKYTTYRFDIDPDSKTFRFYLKADAESGWTEPYANIKFSNPYTPDTADTFDKGLLPTGTLPTDDIVALSLSSGCYISASNPTDFEKSEAKKEVSYYISNISIRQLKIPVIESVSISDGERYVRPDSNINITFKSGIYSGSVNKENVYLSQVCDDGVEKPVSADVYNVECTNDNKGIILSFNSGKSLDYLSDYKLYVKNIEADSEARGKMTGIAEIAFKTLGRYEIDKESTGISDNLLTFNYNLKDYVKANNGNGYVIIAALVKKDTNTTFDIKTETNTSVFAAEDVTDTAKSVDFALPENFGKDDYEIRLYVWDSFVNSSQIYGKTNISID